jgi:uncharacterized protein with von Willebrand factor type A (vWA) domain
VTENSRRTDDSTDPAPATDGGPGVTDDFPTGAGRSEPPDFVAARDHVRESLVRFARSLRRAGVDVPANAATEAARALVVTGLNEDRARTALRATMVSDHRDLDAFDRQFPEFWRRLTAGLDPNGPADRPEDGPDGGLAPLSGSPADGESSDGSRGDGQQAQEDREDATTETTAWVGGDGDELEDGGTATASVSSRTGSPERLSASPATASSEDLAGPMHRLSRALATLDGRRWQAAGRGRVDARRALRDSFGTGGVVVDVPRRDRKRTAVRALLLVDVSQSVLDVVDRGFLLSFVHRAVASWRHVRAFFFDEGIREVTGAFEAETTAGAVAELERAEAEWGGGTRIGSALSTVRREFPDAVDRDTAVFVVSDGLETGDVDELAENVAWLSRRARTLLWCNPLAASPEFEPATRGMAASISYVDAVFAFAGPGDVAEVARQLRLYGTGTEIGYEHDPRRRDGTTQEEHRQ